MLKDQGRVSSRRISTGAAICALVALGAGNAHAAAPTLTSGTILTPTVTVAKPPSAPVLKLQIHGPAAAYVYYQFTGPSGENVLYSYQKQGPGMIGVNKFQGDAIGNGVFGLYAEPGTWTLTQLQLCDSTFNHCTFYDPTTLPALFSSLTINVVNHNAPDFTPPQIQSGALQTTPVSLATSPTVNATLAISDDLSGVSFGNICLANTVDSTKNFCLYGYTQAPALSGTLYLGTTLTADSTDTSYVPPGTYAITGVALFDVAGNPKFVNNSFSSLFSGGTTITVTN